jgi:NADH-quinone oxidoreductase subunit N
MAKGSSIEGFDAVEAARMCVEGLLFYLFVYLFMNLGAFAVIALLRNQTFSEELDSFNGVGWQAPALCTCMVLCIFSLVGLPPLGGFWGKLVIFMSLFNIASNVHWFMWVLLVVGGANTVFSLFYYIKILKAMFMKEPLENAGTVEVPSTTGNYALLIALPVLLLGLFPTWTTSLAHGVATWLIP